MAKLAADRADHGPRSRAAISAAVRGYDLPAASRRSPSTI
jgi:hypothetical protein